MEIYFEDNTYQSTLSWLGFMLKLGEFDSGAATMFDVTPSECPFV